MCQAMQTQESPIAAEYERMECMAKFVSQTQSKRQNNVNRTLWAANRQHPLLVEAVNKPN